MRTLLAGIYFLCLRCWNFLYERKWIIPKRVNAMVVSVGNLTVGGTGKTPFTIFLAKHYQSNGYTVGIVSRGYKGNYQGAVALVSDGTTLFGSAAMSGDEPMMMARRLSGVSIAVSKDRYLGCQLLIEKFKVNLILLDDGFQHRRLYRDLNLLLIDATQQNHSLLPKGPMREPVSAASRASVVIVTRQENDASHIHCVEAYQWTGPTLHAFFSPVALIHVRTGVSKSPSNLKGEKILVFCGIGNPQSLLKILNDLGAIVCESIVFQDHYSYTDLDAKKIGRKGKTLGVAYIVTTEKDAMKVESLSVSEMECFALRIEMGVREPAAVWEKALHHEA